MVVAFDALLVAILTTKHHTLVVMMAGSQRCAHRQAVQTKKSPPFAIELPLQDS